MNFFTILFMNVCRSIHIDNPQALRSQHEISIVYFKKRNAHAKIRMDIEKYLKIDYEVKKWNLRLVML